MSKEIREKHILKNIPVDYLYQSKYQPRHVFNQESLIALAETIKNVGVIAPIIVRQMNEKQYEIIAGERRWRAAQIAHLEKLPCIISDYSDEKAFQVALTENMNREDLNPVEEARGIQRLLDEFGYTHLEAAAILGKARSHVTNLLRLLKLDERVQAYLLNKELQEVHGKILAGLPVSLQYTVAKECVEKQWSSRFLGEMVKKISDQSIRNDKRRDADVVRLEQSLSDFLGYQVTIDFRKNGRGSLKIYFDSPEHFEGVLDKIGYAKSFT